MESPSRQRHRNFYSGTGLDRADHRRLDGAWLESCVANPATHFVPVWRARNLIRVYRHHEVQPAAVWLTAPDANGVLDQAGELVFLGLRAERPIVAVDLSELEPEAAEATVAGHGVFRDLREVGPLMARAEGAILAYARGLMHWHRHHRFCGYCSGPTENVNAGHVRRCINQDCGKSHFPRTDPAVIMLIHDGGNRCVLGRQKIWPPGMHSTLAGFVEPGEGLEEAVAREVLEEVGLELSDIRYHSSQPWPFPSSLMLGFYARASGGSITVDQIELESAQWFTRAELEASPEDEKFRLPRRDSIARRLIEDWLAHG